MQNHSPRNQVNYPRTLKPSATENGGTSPIYYVDLTVRSGVAIEEALAEARDIEARRLAAGFDQNALELTAREALANGAFEDSEEDGSEVVEEFFTQEPGERCKSAEGKQLLPEKRPLIDKLGEKMAHQEQAL